MNKILSTIKKIPYCLWALLLIPSLAFGDIAADSQPTDSGEPWNIQAHSFVCYHRTGVIIGYGGVKVYRGKVSISSDRMIYDQKRGKVRAEGSVVIHLAEDVLSGSMGEFDLNTSTGSIKDAHLFLKRNNVHLVAENIWKTGPEEYKAHKAVISTCPLPKQAWSFRCKNLRLTVNGIAKARHATFNIRKIPVFYTPWVAVPLNRYRKTGVLLPAFSMSSRNGTELIVPFFWAINDSMDATFYQHPIANRGWMEGMEFRHMFSKENRGILRYNFLWDSLKDDDYNEDSIVRSNKKRWWLRAKMEQALPWDMHAKLDIDLVSDKDYLQEFDQGPMSFFETNQQFKSEFGRSLADNTDVIRPSFLQITRLIQDHFMAGEIRYNDNQMPGEQKTTIQTLPRFAFHGFSQRLGKSNFYWDYKSSYVYYWRDKNVREQRLHLEPRLSRPWKLGRWADLVLSGSLQETAYAAYQQNNQQNPDDTSNRLLYLLQGDMSTTFARNYRKGSKTELRHTIRPRFIYQYRPNKNQDNLPDIDDLDRLEPLNKLTYSLLSFLSTREQKETGARTYQDILRFKLQQSYDFRADSRPFSDLYAEFEFKPYSLFYLRYDTTYNFYGDGFTTHNVWGHMSSNSGNCIDMSYRYSTANDIDQINLNMLAVLTDSWYGTFGITKSFNTDTEISSSYGLGYRATCWSFKGTFTRNSYESKFIFYIELLGIGGWGNQR